MKTEIENMVIFMKCKAKQISMPIEILLECIEIKDDMLVWKSGWREKNNLSRSKAYPAGEKVKPAINIKNKCRYIRINAGGVSYYVSYSKAILAVKHGAYQSGKGWLIDGDITNLNVSNVSETFVPWWDRLGVNKPSKKKKEH